MTTNTTTTPAFNLTIQAGATREEIAQMLKTTADYLLRWETFPGVQHIQNIGMTATTAQGHFTWDVI